MSVATIPICRIVIEQTPHPCLSPNRRAHWSRRAEYVRALKWAAKAAMVNLLVDHPLLTSQLSHGRLRLTCRVEWEKGRKLWDSADNIKLGLKPVLDGIALALDVDDRDFRLADVTQVQTSARQGCVVCDVEAWE